MPRLPRPPHQGEDGLVINARTGMVHRLSCWVPGHSPEWVMPWEAPGLDDDTFCSLCLPAGRSEAQEMMVGTTNDDGTRA